MIGRIHFIVDPEDEVEVSKYTWNFNSSGYLRAWTGTESLELHIFLLGRQEGRVIDHIDGNKLNNSRSNLRFVTSSQNAMNRKKMPSKSGHTGIIWREDKQFWQANIGVRKRKIHLGCFYSLEAAVKARKDAELRYFGEFRRVQ